MIARIALAFLLWPVVALGQTHVCSSRSANPAAIHASLKRVYEIAGKRLHIDPDLAQAITQIESGFDPHALSPKGAQGLMQLMPETSAAMHVADPLDPHQSILGGMQFLRVLANDPRYAGNPYMVLVAYNAGPNRASFPEESYRYADAVLAVYQQLKAQHVRRGGLIEPTQSLDRSFLGAIQCGQAAAPTARVAVAGGKVQPSRHYH
jgi:soluble lytic murein transglycosylase-like protein